MSARYCLPIIKSSKKQVLDQIERFQKDYEVFEVWLDYIRDIDPEFVQSLINMLPENRLLLLFRRQNLEQVQLPFDTRINFIRSVRHDTMLDLDIGTQRDEIDFIRSEKIAPLLVLSYHNYKYTPEIEELHQLVSEMAARGAQICKIATLCRTNRDALRLLDFLLEIRGSGQRCIVLGMGEPGKITRIFGSLWGNELIYAPPRLSDASAPGQLTRKQMEALFKELR